MLKVGGEGREKENRKKKKGWGSAAKPSVRLFLLEHRREPVLVFPLLSQAPEFFVVLLAKKRSSNVVFKVILKQ